MNAGPHFCTYFDANYLYKGLALYSSLREHSPAFTLHVLCLDTDTLRLLSELHLPCVELIGEEEFLNLDEPLARAKRDRSRVEYYWTCTASLPLFVLARHPEIDTLTYLDADLFFFADPSPVLAEIEGNSVLITEHRYSPELRHLETRGLYNVQFIAVRRDETGLGCLRWWRERCIEWCHNRPEDGRFGDQKYLDEWPGLFSGVHVVEHRGAGIAPWNVDRYRVEERDGVLTADGWPLIFYHFHQFRILRGGRFYYASSVYSRHYPDLVYRPYVEAIRQAIAQVAAVDPTFHAGIEGGARVALQAAARRWLPTGVKNAVKRLLPPGSGMTGRGTGEAGTGCADRPSGGPTG